MYGKVFTQMYDGTLVQDWQALITFQQFIVLCDSEGVVDMTPLAIANRTGIPVDIIAHGIEVLELPDRYSRTPDEEGRRIIRIDAHRPWGWQIVNYKKYCKLVNREEKKETDRQRIAAKREAEKANKISSVAKCRKVSQGVADVAHIDIDIDINNKNTCRASATGLLELLNSKTGSKYQPVDSNLNLITARLREFPEEGLRSMVERKCREWGSDERMAKYLRPATLFNATKCAQYMGEASASASSEFGRGAI